MKPEVNYDKWDEGYFYKADQHDDFSEYIVDDGKNDIKDYGTEHQEADEVITKYVNDGDKAFRELLHMLEQNEPKMEARMIKPFTSENPKANLLKLAIICFSLIAVLLIILIITVIIKRTRKPPTVSEDKSKCFF